MDAEGILGELRGSHLRTIAEASSPEGAPTEHGFYAWWATPGAIPGLRATPHPAEPFELLYVGIAPRSESSKARLRSRLLRQHIGGNVGSSTFRLGLAALLWKHEGWTPRLSGSGKVRLDASDNAALSAWQCAHLRLRWAVVPEPWRFEMVVITTMCPPMNREHNERHPFHDEMGKARDRFRAAARERL